MKKLGIIIQARMGSTRLPGKVLIKLQGTSILGWCIKRLRKVGDSIPVIVATSDLPQDDPVEKEALIYSIACYRGSEEDVLDRYYQAACKYSLDGIIRATADNPLTDFIEGKRLVDCFENASYDYIENFGHGKEYGLPTGTGLELFSFAALEQSWNKGKAAHHREHVNEYMLEHPEIFTSYHLPCLPENSNPKLRLTVDTPEDFAFVKSVIGRINKPLQDIRTEDVITLCKEQL